MGLQWTDYKSGAFEAKKLFATAKRVKRVTGYWKGSAVAYLLIFDSATEVSDGTTPFPIFRVKIAANDNFGWDGTEDGVELANGLFVAISSSETQLTLDSANAHLHIAYLPT